MLPARVLHADWSTNPRKRWMSEAVLGEDNRYTATAPKFIRDPGLFMLTLINASKAGVLVSFDFPIGLPLAYAQKVGITHFLNALPIFGEEGGDWADFYTVATKPEEISLTRPFYPAKAGGSKRAQLTTALGIDDLRRVCDRQTADRKAAAELFWTMGAQQVGKAAINGWQELLAPAMRLGNMAHLAIWPFAGAFQELLQPGRIVACEAYPAEFYGHLGVKFPRKAGTRTGKRIQADRIANASVLTGAAKKIGITLDPTLKTALKDGFGADSFGEDRFDSLVGLFGMLNVVLGHRPAGDPQNADIAQIEGWILGMNNN